MSARRAEPFFYVLGMASSAKHGSTASSLKIFHFFFHLATAEELAEAIVVSHCRTLA